MFGDVTMGLGEYLTLWLIIAFAVIAVLGWLFGVAGMGALLFFVAAALTILIIYAVLSRIYRFGLHGSISGEGADD